MMIKVVRVTFDCKGEFDAGREVGNAIRSHMFQLTKKAREVTSYDVVELSAEAIEEANRMNLASSMDRLAEEMAKFREEMSDKQSGQKP